MPRPVIDAPAAQFSPGKHIAAETMRNGRCVRDGIAAMSRLNVLVNRAKSQPLVATMLQRMPGSIKATARRMVDRMSRPSLGDRLHAQISQTNDILARMMYESAFATPRFQEPKRLLKHGFKVYSQHDEDGIIEEIFRRIGTTDRFFVEFGVGDGLENCTSYCLLKGWSGIWMEGSEACYQRVLRNLDFLVQNGRLRVRRTFITAENIERLFDELGVPREFDLLSIDIDRNDYWVWQALRDYRPRVVAIEYNASFKQTVACVIPYAATAIWDETNYSGCSLKAVEVLGRLKGYRLVGCNYTGVTAFLVREDCCGDHFAQPYTSEHHYEPPRYFVRMPNGHPANFGPVVLVDVPDDAEPRPVPPAPGSSALRESRTS